MVFKSEYLSLYSITFSVELNQISSTRYYKSIQFNPIRPGLFQVWVDKIIPLLILRSRTAMNMILSMNVVFDNIFQLKKELTR